MLSEKKTKLVCTIGPASDDINTMVKMIEAGMNIARLNYSHGSLDQHKAVISRLREAEKITKKRLVIMADLPGPKMRIGKLKNQAIELKRGDKLTLTTKQLLGTPQIISVSFSNLPKVVKKDDLLYLNDGIIQLVVDSVLGTDVLCQVRVGGELRSHKGLNLPNIKLGIKAFTSHDKACLKSALENGVDAISQSFVESADDINAVRKYARKLGHNPFVIAKVERADALNNLDEILQVTDGIMVARGDLGVETHIEGIALLQKTITKKANKAGKPVITATQMLESMCEHPRPTRAEATDVANAILDGTDCLMLSEESAMGKYPVEAVQMLSQIAIQTEAHRSEFCQFQRSTDYYRDDGKHLTDILSHNVWQTVQHLQASLVVTHTVTGHTARMLTRFRLPVWIVAVSESEMVCKGLQFSYGVYPLCIPEPKDWNSFVTGWLKNNHLPKCPVVLVEGPSPANPKANHRIEIILPK